MDLSRYIRPRNGRFNVSDRNRGDKSYNEILDNTGTMAHRAFVAGMMANGTNQAREWFRLETPDMDLNRYQPVRVWLDDTANRLRYLFRRSRTYEALREVYSELGLFGTAADLVVPDFDRLWNHYPLTWGEYAIGIDYTGRVDSLYREFQMTVAQVVAEFGYDKCSESIKSQYWSGNYYNWVTIIHAIEPRRQREAWRGDAMNMPFRSAYFELGAGKEHNELLREGGYRRFPGIVPRFDVGSGNIYGMSPAMEALGDIKGLQVLTLNIAEVAAQLAEPSLQGPPGLKDQDVNRLPGGFTPTPQNGPNSGVRRLHDQEPRLDHLLLLADQHRNRINEAFYKTKFEMLANLADTSKTAREVAERVEEKLAALGPLVDAVQTDINEPLVDLGFDRLLEIDGLSAPPPELSGATLQVEFVSVMAQAQKAQGIGSIDRYVATLGQIAALGRPEVLDNMDVDQMSQVYGDMLGVPAAMVTPSQQVALIREARAESMKAKEQAEMLGSVSSSTKNFASAAKDSQAVPAQ
jgi:hypothetical protein